MKIKRKVSFQELIGNQHRHSIKKTYIIEGEKENFGQSITDFVRKSFGHKWDKFVVVEQEDILPIDELNL